MGVQASKQGPPTGHDGLEGIRAVRQQLLRREGRHQLRAAVDEGLMGEGQQAGPGGGVVQDTVLWGVGLHLGHHHLRASGGGWGHGA